MEQNKKSAEQLQAEIDMLRGVDCEAGGDGPCGACLKCAIAGKHVAQKRPLRVPEDDIHIVNSELNTELMKASIERHYPEAPGTSGRIAELEARLAEREDAVRILTEKLKEQRAPSAPKTEVVGPLTARLRAMEDVDDRPSDAQSEWGCEARRKLGIARGVLEEVRHELWDGGAFEHAKADVEKALADSAMPHTKCENVPDWVAPAYVADRREQYKPSSASYEALSQVMGGLARGTHVEAWKRGELDDLKKDIERIRKEP